MATGTLYAQADLTDLLDDAQDAADAHRSPRAPAPPPGQGGAHAGAPAGTFGGVIVSGLEAGVAPTETITANGRPGNDSDGDLPGQCPLCGMDTQGTSAQGADDE